MLARSEVACTKVYMPDRKVKQWTASAGCRAGRLMIYTFNDTREEPLRLDMQLLLGKGEHINCVRFMQVDGQEYLVVADEVPPPPSTHTPTHILGLTNSNACCRKKGSSKQCQTISFRRNHRSFVRPTPGCKVGSLCCFDSARMAFETQIVGFLNFTNELLDMRSDHD